MRLAAALLCVAIPLAALPEERATTKDAEAMVHRAVAFYKANGKEKALAAFGDKQGAFFYRDLFVYAMSTDGVMLAHPFATNLVGKDQKGYRDVDGKPFTLDLIATAKAGKGWVEYKFKNPSNGKIEPKVAYLEVVDGVMLVCGAYRPH